MFPSQRVIANIAPIGTTDVIYLKNWNFVRLMCKITEQVDKKGNNFCKITVAR